MPAASRHAARLRIANCDAGNLCAEGRFGSSLGAVSSGRDLQGRVCITLPSRRWGVARAALFPQRDPQTAAVGLFDACPGGGDRSRPPEIPGIWEGSVTERSAQYDLAMPGSLATRVAVRMLTMSAIDALGRDLPTSFIVTDRPRARCPMVCCPRLAPGDHDRTVEVEAKIHLMNAGFGHHRAQPSAVMRVKQQEAAAAGAHQLTPGCATATERKLI